MLVVVVVLLPWIIRGYNTSNRGKQDDQIKLTV
jgi:hypothetical protein